MGVKQTQIAYDDVLNERKKKTGKTWKEVVLRGVEAFEADVGVKFVGDNPPTKKEENQDKPLRGKTEDLGIVDESEPQFNNGLFEIVLTKPAETLVREFDVLEDDSWRTVPFTEIEEGEIFRIRDDGKVTSINNIKLFSYEGLPYKNERGWKCATVFAEKL